MERSTYSFCIIYLHLLFFSIGGHLEPVLDIIMSLMSE